jgi:hypothetical protein
LACRSWLTTQALARVIRHPHERWSNAYYYIATNAEEWQDVWEADAVSIGHGLELPEEDRCPGGMEVAVP